MAKKIREPDFSEETVKKKRIFPRKNVVLILLLVAVQIALIMLAVLVRFEPKDEIEYYGVHVETRNDGSLDIEYNLRWKPLDEDEPLSWVEIGLANPSVSLVDWSGNVRKAEVVDYGDGYVYAELEFRDEYKAGETVEFSFSVNQRDMLFEGIGGTKGYEFVPGWFNSVSVKHYEFTWSSSGAVASNAPEKHLSEYSWSGSLERGGYVIMSVDYGAENFSGANTVKRIEFDSDGAYDQLAEDRMVVVVLAVIAIALVLIAEMYIADSFVSYSRGRGFLSGYGHHVHIYGYSNPAYRAAAAKHAASSGGVGGGGRGCACACACACAGGGRAGCSRKDTVSNISGG